MSNFPRLQARRLFRVVNGGTPRADAEFWDGDVAWATPVDLGVAHGEVLSTTQRTLTKAGLETGSRSVPSGSLILSTRAPIGYVSEAGRQMAFNQGCRGLVPQQELDSRFYRYTFVALSDDLSSFGQGSTFTELPSDSLAEFRIPAPPLTQQRAIADYLDAETARIDALIEKKLKLRQLLKEQLAVHIERVIWDGASGTTPLMYLTPSARQIMYGIVLPGPDVEGGVPIIKGGNVASGKLEPHQLARTTCEIESNYVRSRIAEDDVLYAIRGGIGDVAIASKNIVGANITQDVARVAPRADVDSRWIRYALESVTARADALGRVVGATVKGLNIWDLKRVRVPNRNSDEMRAQANELNEIERYTKEIRQRLDQQTQLLTEHRQALITAAVTGELEVAGAPPAEPRR